jgi:hypothetical protein
MKNPQFWLFAIVAICTVIKLLTMEYDKRD